MHLLGSQSGLPHSNLDGRSPRAVSVIGCQAQKIWETFSYGGGDWVTDLPKQHRVE